jgi:Transglutaminase-like superfamily
MMRMPDQTSIAAARPASLLTAVSELAVAAIVLVAADVVVRIVPFRVIARRVQRTLHRSPSSTDAAIARVKWAVCAAHRRLRWIPCLATAVAANRLLAWRGVASKIWLGVNTSEETTMAAHAWLEAEGCVVTGGAEKKKFHPLHALVTSRAAVS